MKNSTKNKQFEGAYSVSKGVIAYPAQEVIEGNTFVMIRETIKLVRISK